MAFLIALLIYLVVLGFGMALNFQTQDFAFNPGEINYFIDTPALLIIFPPSLAFAFYVAGKKHASGSSESVTRKITFLNALGNSGLWLGFSGALIGMMQMLQQLGTPSLIGPPTATVILSMFYAIGIKMLCQVRAVEISLRAGLLERALDSGSHYWAAVLYPGLGILSVGILVLSFVKL